MKSKKAILFTIVTFIMLIPIILLSFSFSNTSASSNDNFVSYLEAEQQTHIEADITKNAYSQLLNINLIDIERSTSVTAKFSALLMPYANNIMNVINYKNFAEGRYSIIANTVITLTGFNHTFRIQPYNTTFSSNGTAIYLYTMPLPTNYIESIAITIKTNSTFANDCEVPGNDGGSFPAVSAISVTYINITGETCTQSRGLDPIENNDKANSRQFYQSLKSPSGSIETKFGEINGIDGVLAIIMQNATANITQLDMQYTAIETPMILSGGNITITTPTMSKNTKIILAEE